ncbi:hypothetical protein J7T55_009777 [Diaporthe amygdali]|uniref:uncharacterized protein n=1 Tax=Phomopsis amygdali TaxID=1214568 RepID=UPI0022FE4867|nr:uncharacterized protein J7T55_009777 [Diaporthe amygdali]KAJ0116627.1 hypothetical protein J7T55_009777 [Diaporthe amygdali]
MPYYSEGEGRRPRWKFWRSKSGETSQASSTAKQSSSRSDDSYRAGSSRRLHGQTFENASLPGQIIESGSDASSEPKESIASPASPSLNPRSLSNASIAPVEHTKSTSTSTSSPVVKRDTYTDPVTGELTITMTTTTITTTTTTRIIKIPPATNDEVDLDEERRLAAEYLESNGLNSPRVRPGLQPAPRRAGSHSNLISRATEQSFGPRPTADRTYSLGSRTGPPPSFSAARNFSRPGLKHTSTESQSRLSLDARRGLKRAELLRSKSLILKKPEQKPADPPQHTMPDFGYLRNQSQPMSTTANDNSHARPHTRGGGEVWSGSRPHITFHKPRPPYPPSPPAEEMEISPRRGSWGTFGGQGAKKHQQITNNFILGIPNTGSQLGNMF